MANSVQHKYCVYSLTNHTGTLYIGVTNDLARRVYEHKELLVDGFTKKYRMTRLIYFEETQDVHSAIEREKQIKRWRREKKIRLIENSNPDWLDLSDDWYDRRGTVD